MKIVITGSTGYIGENLLKELVKKGYTVYALVRNKSNTKKIEQCIDKDKILNILDNKNLLYKKMSEIKPDILIHLAGVFISDHSESDIEELLNSNIRDASIILDAVCKSGCKSIINTGSYWQNYNNEEYNPVNLYSATKEAFEKIIEYYTQSCKCKAITLRLFDTYGRDDPRIKLLNILNELNDGDEIDVTAGEQYVYFCYIDDVIDAYIQAIRLISQINDGEHKVYDVRSNERKKLKEIIQLYANMSKKKIKINFGGRGYRQREFMNPIGYNDILDGWSAKYTLINGLKEFIK